ncbi:hypothetical protein GCM10008916_02820 [Clostridium nitritogenes]|uniref:Uncharacterized protein n=1 Tax=Clostridium nitritogenes TaxID=83340 RepID=A0ABN1LGQ1_9CLOT
MQYLLILIFDIFIFEECISRIIPQIRYFDEILSIISIFCVFVIICLRPKRIKILNKNDLKIIKYLLVFIVIGFLSTFIYNKNFNITIGMLKDILAVVKPFMNFLFFTIIFKNVDKDKLLVKVSKRCRLYLAVMFIFCIMNYFINIGMDHGVRFGFRVFTFLYTHPTYLAFSVIILICILIANNNKKNNIYIVFGMIILISTFRSKAFIFVLSYLLINIYYKYSSKFKVRYFIIIGIIGVLCTSSKIEDYFIHGLDAARPALYIIGLKILIDYFPFGTGFCSFGSSLSGKYYSPVYAQYGINNVSGLTIDNYAYMADSFWPYIVGQFGLSGLIIYLLMLLNIYKSIKLRYSLSKNKQKAVDLLIFYLLFASTAEAIFIDVTGQFAFIILAVFLGNYEYNKNFNLEREDLK